MNLLYHVPKHKARLTTTVIIVCTLTHVCTVLPQTQAAPLQSHPGPSPHQPFTGPTHPGPPTYNPFPPPNMYSPFGVSYVRPPLMMGTRGTGPPPPMHPSHPAHAVPMVSAQPQGTAVGHLSHNQPSICTLHLHHLYPTMDLLCTPITEQCVYSMYVIIYINTEQYSLYATLA